MLFILTNNRLLERCTFGAEVFNCNERFKWQPSDASSCVTYMDPEHRRRHGSPITETTGFLYGLSELFSLCNFWERVTIPLVITEGGAGW